MIGESIRDDEPVVVHRQQMAEHGDTVVGLVEDEATVKHFHLGRGVSG